MEADTTLLQAARRMDPEALAQIFDLYVEALYQYAISLCPDPLVADHVVGNVFGNLVDQLSCGNGPTTDLHSYLFESTYHLIIQEARPHDLKSSLEAENGELFAQRLQIIRQGLTVYQRHVIFLRYMEGFSLRETATILGKSVNIIRAAQKRALGNLRKTLMSKQAKLH